MVVLLLPQDIDGPLRVTCDELRIRPAPEQKLAGQCLVARAQCGDVVGLAQMLAQVEHPQVPISLGGGA